MRRTGFFRGFLSRLLIPLGFLAAILISMAIFLHTSEPPRQPPFLAPYEGYDPASMRQSMSPGGVGAKLDTILANGSRFIGQEGWRKPQDLIRQT